MKKLYAYFSAIASALLMFFAFAIPAMAAPSATGIGGTGTTSPSGILYGDNGATSHLNTTSIGNGLSFSTGILSNTGLISAFCPGGFLSCSGTNPITFTLGTLGVANGGTGSTTLSGILKGNGTSQVGTVVIGSGLTYDGTTLAASGGSGSSGLATTSLAASYPLTLTTTSAAATYGIDFGTTTSNTWAGTQTFTNAPVFGSLSGVFYGNSGALKSIATSSVSAGTGISLSAGAGALVGTGGLTITNTGVTSTSCTTVTCSGLSPLNISISTNAISLSQLAQVSANTILGNSTGSTGNVTAIATSSLGVALSDTTGTLSIARGGTGSTTAPQGQVLYGGASSYQSVATSSVSFSAPLSTSGTAGALVGGTALTVSLSTTGGLTTSSNQLAQVEHPSFTYATTSWTGTTTIPLGIGWGQTWNSVRCVTDAGTLNVDLYHASSHTNFFNASTTKGIVTLSTNNAVTSGDTMQVDLGTPASSPTKITCTVADTI